MRQSAQLRHKHTLSADATQPKELITCFGELEVHQGSSGMKRNEMHLGGVLGVREQLQGRLHPAQARGRAEDGKIPFLLASSFWFEARL
mmetsp:Transcript_9310/g.10532  ORF Transcript_9310/g.10532 Transcript_9310/m.10532 type:complete len:89 (-) Transcript_9310:1745-2011(-)